MSRKKVLAFILSICVALSMMPSLAFAEEVSGGSPKTIYVDSNATGEKPDGKESNPYKTLEAAMGVAKDSDTIKLLSDIAESVTLGSTAGVTLDLNDKKLTGGNDHAIKVVKDTKLTINDTGANKTGTVDSIVHGKAAIYNEGTITLNGGNYLRSMETGTNPNVGGSNSYYNILSHGVMTINDGVKVSQTGHYSSLIASGWSKGGENTGKTDSVLTINGGFFSGGINTIKNDDYGILTINGGVFENITQHAVQNHNIAKVTGGKFTGTEKATVILANNADPSSGFVR
ncbi:MAG: hypothetical protein RR536_04365 [Anaerovoracaceae bacterium]